MSQHAIKNAAAWYQSICEMVAGLDSSSEDDESAQQRIHESVLSVEVRDGWRVIGGAADLEEYSILLTTGGPALRLYGRLTRYNEPENDPILQWQDWGTL